MATDRVQLGPFSLEVPEVWTLSTVILAGPIEESPIGAGMPTTKTVQPFQRNLVATMEQVEKSDTLEGYVARQVDELKKAGVPRQDAAKPERVKLAGGLDGLVTEQIITGASGERVRQMQLVCIKKKDNLLVAHTVIASHLDGAQFERARAEFRKMLLSFQ